MMVLETKTNSCLRSFALCVALLALSGCSKAPGPAAAKPEDDNKPKVEMSKDIPGLKEAGGEAEEKPGAVEILVKDQYDRTEKETYRYDAKQPGGTIKGSCRFATVKNPDFPPDTPIDFTGDTAIKDPARDELKSYSGIGLRTEHWVQRFGDERHGFRYVPVNVAIMLRGVEVGRRKPLVRPVMVVKEGQILVGGESNFGSGNIQFGPTHERAQFTTWDSFPSRIVVTQQSTGKAVFAETVRYLQTADNKEKGATDGFVYTPQFITTPPLREPGVYVVTDSRHPWMRGFLLVLDNPYAAKTDLNHENSNFTISDVPPGKHILQAWHPCFKPVTQQIEVDVKADTITEVLVQFEAPEKAVEKAPAKAPEKAPEKAPAAKQ